MLTYIIYTNIFGFHFFIDLLCRFLNSVGLFTQKVTIPYSQEGFQKHNFLPCGLVEDVHVAVEIAILIQSPVIICFSF